MYGQVKRADERAKAAEKKVATLVFYLYVFVFEFVFAFVFELVLVFANERAKAAEK